MQKFSGLFVSAIFAMLCVCIQSSASASEVNERVGTEQAQRWIDRVFQEHIPQYANVQHCIEFTSFKLKLQPELLIAVMLVENGGTNRKRRNDNGTYDYGIFQINDVRMPELNKFQVTEEELIANDCLNAFLGGYILASEIKKAESFWQGVGNYHYGVWGKYPHNHYRYIQNVYQQWMRLTQF